jgi:hypothetical protein
MTATLVFSDAPLAGPPWALLFSEDALDPRQPTLAGRAQTPMLRLAGTSSAATPPQSAGARPETTGLCDLYQYVGDDLMPANTGDLQPAGGVLRGQQRVLRRLLTNPGDYIFHPDYGAGLPKWVGQPLDIAKMTALIRGQILLEDAVSKTPAPVIAVTPVPVSGGGGVFVRIQYTDAASGQPATLQFNLSK